VKRAQACGLKFYSVKDVDPEADADVPVLRRAPSARLNDSKNLLLHTDRPMRIIPGVVPASQAPQSGINGRQITQAGQQQPLQQASHPLDEIGIALAFWCIDHGESLFSFRSHPSPPSTKHLQSACSDEPS
jgi:hypothetical protein